MVHRPAAGGDRLAHLRWLAEEVVTVQSALRSGAFAASIWRASTAILATPQVRIFVQVDRGVTIRHGAKKGGGIENN
ncbi:MAG: hypothetical protein ABW185_05405 [Sedimenticola sp.]